MKGLDLSERFFRTWALPVLEENCAAELDRCAAGLIGPNSQVIGYDDDLSHDHAWGPFFILWTSDDFSDEDLERIRHVLMSASPNEFLDHPLSAHRDSNYNMPDFVVTRIGDAQEYVTGVRGFPENDLIWMTIPESRLFELTSGRVFHDPSQLVTSWREQYAYFPENVWLKRVSFAWYALSASGQIPRLVARQDPVAVHIFCGWFLEASMRLALLLERKYSPWRKWLFRYLGEHWTGDPGLLIALGKIADSTTLEEKGDAVAVALDILGEFANNSDVIPAQSLRAAQIANMHDFNFGGFATAYMQKLSGPLAGLSLDTGPVDLWGSLHVFAAPPPRFMNNSAFLDAVYGQSN